MRISAVFDAVLSLLKRTPPFFVTPTDDPIVRPDSIVVAHHPRVRAIGEKVLAEGGNAVDAFVAVIAAQNVMAEGASSFAGPLGVLTYVRTSDAVEYLDADFNDPLEPGWRWRRRMPRDGRAVLVPGAPAGLEELAATRGTRPLRDLLQPAIELAEDGYPVSRLLASFIAWRARILKRSEYGRRTYFGPRGKPLQAGEILRQPELASFVTRLAADGSDYVYSGPWGRRFLEDVRARRGVLTDRDLAHYRPRWKPPWTTDYRGRRIFSCSGRSYASVWTLLALKTWEQSGPPSSAHYSTEPEALGALVQTARRVWSEPWIVEAEALDDPQLVEQRLTDLYARGLWDEIARELPRGRMPATQAHSYHVVVVDPAGNVASGTTTIESDPWGEGMFVEGVPLSPAGTIPWSTAPGERRLSPFSMHFAFDDDRLRFAVGGISNSVAEATFQFLVNLIDYGLPVEEAATAPRFGTFPARRRVDVKKNWLDPRIDSSIVRELKGRLTFERSGLIDTGSGAIVSAREGELAAMPVPIPYIADPFAEEP